MTPIVILSWLPPILFLIVEVGKKSLSSLEQQGKNKEESPGLWAKGDE